MLRRSTNVLVLICVVLGGGSLAFVYWYTRPAQVVSRLIEERRFLDETVWAQEVAAQKYEETIVKYWDRMLFPEDDKYAVLAEFPFHSITVDALEAPKETLELEWGITRTSYGGSGKTLDRNEWREFLREMASRGFVIDAIEFHQSSFEIDSNGNAVSVFDVLLNAANGAWSHRWSFKSKLRVDWTDEIDEEGHFIPGDLTLFDTHVLDREGPAVFERHILEPNNLGITIPIVYDMNRDGFSDILLPLNNVLMLNAGDGKFEERKAIFDSYIYPLTGPATAVVADFDGDGKVDLLFAGTYNFKKNFVTMTSEVGVYLYRGNAEGRFETEGEEAVSERLSLTIPQSMAVGDIDGDGDLDVWLTQYKNPFEQGTMPTPFYDANDGYPSYLLLNRGDGMFEDGTEAAGLAGKRYRRTFASSFLDIDDDQDLDLLISSDFAGSDLYLNDGAGHFTDITETALDESANFGMGHTFADYNRDGQLDFYVTGMASTTMRRLNQMGLFREDRPDILEMRTRMGYGNRMYLSQGEHTFHQPAFKDNVARSGWAWGVTSLDFDSDGDMDIYVANGHKSGGTTKDYCTRFWCHDVYIDASEPNPILEDLFSKTYTRFLLGLSWDGYQKNHLFMNQSGNDFVNVAFLMNAALIEDSRSVISDDFDGDGRPDLLVTSYEVNGLSSEIHILLNRWPVPNNWVGVRLYGEPGGPSPNGAVIRVRSDSGEQITHVVTGDSYRAQHAPMKHFGLGHDSRVHSITVRWPDHSESVIDSPAINSYHAVSPSTGA